jgi:hypothetical protein
VTDRRVKRFLIPVELIEALLKGGVVTNRPLPAEASIVALTPIPEFGELELAIRSAEYDFVPAHVESIPLSVNNPAIEAKS